jgi:hypothetical protein
VKSDPPSLHRTSIEPAEEEFARRAAAEAEAERQAEVDAARTALLEEEAVRRATLDPNAVGGAPAEDAEREPAAAAADAEPFADLGADLVDCDHDNPRETTEQLREGLEQPPDAVLRAAMRDFDEPERTFEDDETAATFGSTLG